MWWCLPCKKCDKDFLASFWRQFGLVRKWDQIRKENPVIFLANAMKISWLELVQSPYNVWAWKTNIAWINDMEWSWNSVWIWTKPQPDQVELGREIGVTWNFHENPYHIFYRESMQIHFLHDDGKLEGFHCLYIFIWHPSVLKAFSPTPRPTLEFL